MIKQYERCTDFKNFLKIRSLVRPAVPVFAVYPKGNEENARIIMPDEFIDEVNGLGTWFYYNGYRGRHIALLGENSYEWVLTLFAATCGNNVAVLLDITKTSEELCDVVKDCDAEVIIYSSSYAKTAMNIKMQTGITLIPMESIEDKAEEGRKMAVCGCRDFIEHRPDAECMSVICCTSGTTGRSKGVMLCQRNIIRDAILAYEVVNSPDYGKTFAILPLYHIYPLVHNVFMAVAMGGTVCFTGGIRSFVSDYLKIQPEHLYLVPRLCDVLDALVKKNPEVPLPKHILCGGSAPEMKLMKDFAEKDSRVSVGYGLTESTAAVAISTDCIKYNDGSMAFVPGVKHKLIDVDENGVGELLLAGDMIMLGYYKMPEETAKKIDEEGFLHTGDLAVLTEEDRLILKGRKDRMIVLSSGVNVHPQEIEDDLYAIDGVSEVLVRMEDGMITARVYVEDPDRREGVKEAVDEVNRVCPAYRQVENLILVEEPLPKTGAGKIKLG